jgi:hypothetical protein
VTASGLLIATPAQAAPATVYIYKVYYNSPGSDTGSNTSLNAEYVVIRNGDNVSHSVSGWTLGARPTQPLTGAEPGEILRQVRQSAAGARSGRLVDS